MPEPDPVCRDPKWFPYAVTAIGSFAVGLFTGMWL